MKRKTQTFKTFLNSIVVGMYVFLSILFLLGIFCVLTSFLVYFLTRPVDDKTFELYRQIALNFYSSEEIIVEAPEDISITIAPDSITVSSVTHRRGKIIAGRSDKTGIVWVKEDREVEQLKSDISIMWIASFLVSIIYLVPITITDFIKELKKLKEL